jgi:hypothetical protein
MALTDDFASRLDKITCGDDELLDIEKRIASISDELMKSAAAIEPWSPKPRFLTETVPSSASLSPTTSI